MMKFLPSEVEETLKQGRKEVGQGKNGSNVSSSDGNDLTTHKQEDHLKSAQVKMDEVREENERLKFTISQMMKDYNSLKTHLHGIVQQDQPQKSTDSASMTAIDDESELVSLRLGRFSDDSKREQKKSSYESKHQKDTNQLGEFELGLDCKFPSGYSAKLSKNPSPENSLDGSKEEENNTCHKSPKTARSGDDEVLEQNPLKKPRVSVRAVCDTQTMNDGCQWRKYGQKIAKGNPCPRAYYRCTFSSSCPVRKRVQRCAEDVSILTTTYEGTHNHPLPISATSMASATSAAAAMLKCGSSASPPPAHGVSAAASSSSPNLLGFNFPSSNSLSTPCFPRASISTSQSHPTVILDLTVPNQTYSPYNRSSSSSFFPGLPSSSTTCLNFSTSTSQIHNAYQQGILGETNASATKALITRNPTFQSALAAAITSIVGNGGIYDNLDQERKSGQNSKWGDQNINFSQPRSVPSGTMGCYWMNSQKKNLASFPPFSVSTSRASTVFLPDDGEQIKL